MDRSTEESPSHDDSQHDGSMFDESKNLHSHHQDGQEKTDDDVQKLVHKETLFVKNLKKLVVLALAVSAIAVTLIVYFYLSTMETNEFEVQFQDHATKVFSAIGANVDLSLTAADALATGIMASAKATNQTWPFVTIEGFGIQAGKILSLAAGHFIALFTLVRDEERKPFEQYMTTHNQWVEETVAIHLRDSSYNPPMNPDYKNWNVIHGYDEYDKPLSEQGVNGTDKSGPYLASWQCYPAVLMDPVYGWDLTTDIDVSPLLELHQVLLSQPYLIASANDTETQEFNEAEAEWVKNYIDPDENPLEPVSDLYYPLLEDSLDVKDLFKDGNYTAEGNEHKLKGILAISFYWRDKLRSILPPGSDGIVVVFDNPCSPSFTYQLNGPNAVYLGDEDQHDPKYDSMEISSNLADLRDFSIKAKTYSGVPLLDHCPFRIRIYPSEDMAEDFLSNDPIIFSILTTAIFVLTSLTFVIYDVWVERRQRLLMNTAERSTAIVNSLFPAAVREKMYEERSREQQQRENALHFRAANVTEEVQAKNSLAELYMETTVFFGDLAGFTKWSSNRTPEQVFILLENLYQAFDAIALRRKVFKIETIGDCYVAVTGIPDAQPDHAVIMVKFARDCIQKAYQVTHELADSLGPDTAELGLRIGLHSGPTTAGVLRGQKSRFQLFGDTVNMASRMESNGFQGKIHVSQETAAELRKAGKEHWVTPREDLVEAKGKGKLQTFFVSVDAPGDRRVQSTIGVPESSGSSSDQGDPESDENVEKRLAARLAKHASGGKSDFESLTQ